MNLAAGRGRPLLDRARAAVDRVGAAVDFHETRSAEHLRELIRSSASEYDGVAIREEDFWQIITPLEGLAGDEVKCATADAGGVLWLGTENGVSRIAQLP